MKCRVIIYAGNIISVNKPYVHAYCASGKNLSIYSESYQLSELGCKNKVQVECEITNLSCGNKITGYFVNIGYKINNLMSTLYKICYDYNNKVPLYAQHKIYGATISRK